LPRCHAVGSITVDGAKRNGESLREYRHGVQVRLDAMELHRPRQWGACWLACHLYEQLELDRFWAGRLPDSREGTCWQQILQTLVCYRLIDPGSEWRLHRLWFEQSESAPGWRGPRARASG
jgi:hypothetical protein